MSRKGVVFTFLAGTVVVLDQATKFWVQAVFELYETWSVVEGLIQLTYVRNPGAAFGLFAGYSEPFRRTFFLAVSGVALVVILVVLRRLPRGRTWTLAGLGMVFGGAIGNLVDRIRWGEVVDFIDVFWRTYHWPAFNVADSAITVGMGVLILTELLGPGAEKQPGS